MYHMETVLFVFHQPLCIQNVGGRLHITECIGIAKIAAKITPVETAMDTLQTANT